MCINQLQKKFNKRNRKQTIRGKNQHAISRILKEVLLGNIKKREIWYDCEWDNCPRGTKGQEFKQLYIITLCNKKNVFIVLVYLFLCRY